MKKSLLVLFLHLFFVIASHAQRNYAQELVNLIEENRCFEARELRMQYADKLPQNDKALDLLYNLHMAQYFGKPDSVAIYTKDLLANHELKMGPVVGVYYGTLLQAYDDLQQFDEGANVCDRYLEYLKRNPFDLNQEFLQKEIGEVKNIKSSLEHRDKNQPRVKIERGENDGENIKLIDGEYIRFEAKYNDTPMETLFDTGITDYFMITQKLADEIGVKITDNVEDSIKTLNGIPTKAYRGIIEKIELGNIQIYNAPALVIGHSSYMHISDSLSEDEVTKIKTQFGDDQIIMGLLTTKLIGKMEFDWVNRTLSFPKGIERKEPNLYMASKNLYIRTKVNGIGHSGHLDTGANGFFSMSFPFYEKNKNHIKIDSITDKKPLNYQGMTTSSTFVNVPHEIVENPIIYLGGKQINLFDSKVLAENRFTHLNIMDGVVGAFFLYRIAPKVILDLDNMRIEGKE